MLKTSRKPFRAIRLAGVATALSLSFSSVVASGQTVAEMDGGSRLPANWRDIKDGIGGFPAGHMLEIAVRHVKSNKLEMFKWRSEFIAMMNEQPGPQVEREWHAISEQPSATGPGTWTGMTWWENQQRWQDMANVLFATPIVKNWLQTIDMTLIFVKPLDDDFNIRTLAQSGNEVLEVGVLVFPTSRNSSPGMDGPSRAQAYLDSVKKVGGKPYRFAVYPNPTGFLGPFTAAYNANGLPSATGEQWYVYMVSYDSLEARNRLQNMNDVKRAYGAMNAALVKEHSDIQVSSRTTSSVCVKKGDQAVSYDPDTCHVGEMGSGDSWAQSAGERPQGCITGQGTYSLVSPKTCLAVGGRRAEESPATSSSR